MAQATFVERMMAFEKAAAQFEFLALDPRPNAANPEARLVPYLVGIEVTVPALAAWCDLSIDPQHSSWAGGPAAILAVGNLDLREQLQALPAGSGFATVRPDPDAIGAMARAIIVHAGLDWPAEAQARAEIIAEADSAALEPWAPFALRPHMPPGLGALCFDHSRPLPERVRDMAAYLYSGNVPEQCWAQHWADVWAIQAALDSGEINVELVDGVALVHSHHRSAIEQGYKLAPIVVAVNDAFRWPNIDRSHRKVTIAQWNERAGYDFKRLKELLEKLELGWGGSSSILGSPQGMSTALIPTEILSLVRQAKS